MFCAICAAGRPPFSLERLGRDDGLVAVCSGCSEDTPVARQTERGYEPPGGLPTEGEMTAAIRRVMGDAAYQRENELLIRAGMSPSPAMSEADQVWCGWIDESNRRRRTGAAEKAKPRTFKRR